MTQRVRELAPGLLMLMLLLASGPARADQPGDAALASVIAGPQRSAQNKARDQYRHPLATLTFFGLKPDMTVIELWPGGGWYTEILAPYLKDNGKLYEAVGGGEREQAAYKAKLGADPADYAKVIVTELQPPAKTTIAPAGSADMVLTFRNVHDWTMKGVAPDVFKAAFVALKPGGILGVVDHRAKDDAPQNAQDRSGYVRQDAMIKLAEQAGFKLDGQSEINANPKDTRDYPKGVWTLPPTLRMGATDRAKYLAIGESDRMTLKFIKPATQAAK